MEYHIASDEDYQQVSWNSIKVGDTINIGVGARAVYLPVGVKVSGVTFNFAGTETWSTSIGGNTFQKLKRLNKKHPLTNIFKD